MENLRNLAVKFLYNLKYLNAISVFIGGRRGCVTLPKILGFVTCSDEEPRLGFTLHPSMEFVVASESFLPTSHTCGNQIIVPRPTAEKALPQQEHLFNLYDYAFANSYFGKI